MADAGRAFVKMHGLRNHFVLFDAREGGFVPASALVAAICDPETGVGAEQVLLACPPVAGGDLRLRIFNIDGREVGACGNATRCVARWWMDATGHEAVRIETGGGLLACARAGEGVRVAMGRPETRPAHLPFARPRDSAGVRLTDAGPLAGGTAITMGAPHVVFFTPDADAVDLPRDAARVAADPVWRDGINVCVASVLGPSALRLRVWERPGIATKACGTGACAAAYEARRQGLVVGDRIAVDMPGGRLVIGLDPGSEVAMTGPAEYCFAGVWRG